MPKAPRTGTAKSASPYPATFSGLVGEDLFVFQRKPKRKEPRSNASKPPPKKRGRRSPAAQASLNLRPQALQKKQRDLAAWQENTCEAEIPQFAALDVFAHVWKRKPLQSVARKHKLYTDHTRYPDSWKYFTTERFILYVTMLLTPSAPPMPHQALAGYFPNMISDAEQLELIRLWDDLMRSGFVFHSPDADNRSKTAAAHIGFWSHYQNAPFVSKDSYNQNPVATYRLKQFCQGVQKIVDPAVGSILKAIAHHQIPLVRKARRRIRQVHPESARNLRWLNFQNFVTFAVKEGSAEYGHCDFQDSMRYVTLTVSIGTYTTPSYLVWPQLGFKVHMRPGGITAFLARRLMHYAKAPTDGRRLMITCFIDR